MNAGIREELERGDIRGKLVQKLEAYLRAHFDGESAEMSRDSDIERLLLGVARGWCANRGLPCGEKEAAEACREALGRYKSNWKGKKQGEDDRSGALGRALEGNLKEYGL